MIVADRLTKYYGPKAAIEDVSFQIQKGEIVGLLGPNGAGKTTILRILTCFMPPTTGKALINGMEVRTQGLEIRKIIGFLPENVPLYQDLPVFRFLSFAGAAKGLKGKALGKEVDRVTHVCGLTEHKKRLIKHLSKGLKQRVGVAQALVCEPPILILDEPTTGLDPTQIIEIRQLIKNLGGDRTILLSSHILPEVSQLCKRVIIINKGKVVAEDRPQALTERIQKEIRTVVRTDTPFAELEKRFLGMPGITGVVKTGFDEYVIHSNTDDTIRPVIARAIVEEGWSLKELRPKDLSLEEVFVHLVTEDPMEREN